MSSAFTVLYDACVLYPFSVRDLLVEFGRTELFRAKWTNKINDEWMSNLLENNPHVDKARLERTCDLMNQGVSDCLIEDYEWLESSLTLPDKKDVHVLAAAIQGRCDVIVTYNRKHFPKSVLGKHRIEAQHPDEFFEYLISLDSETFLTVFKVCRTRLKKPPLSVGKYLSLLKERDLKKTVEFLSKNSTLI